MNIQSVLPLVFEFLGQRRVEVEVSESPLSSDAGLLPIREFDRRLGWTEGFAAQLTDHRQTSQHALVEMLRQRVFGILAGYEDQNDHDILRSDPVFKLVAGRSPDDFGLASQPTLSRFENGVTAADLLRAEAWFLEKFVESFETPPHSLTLDIGLFDDPTHGQQQLTFFHGFYEQYQYQVRLITCAENAYDDYANRGESENRNKELKCEFLGDRLSDHRYLANCFRVFLHALACNLLARLRRLVADPPPPPPVEPEMPVEARSPRQKRRRHNERRQKDPLGEGHACTWRTMLIKVAATSIVSTRRVRVLLSGSWPYANFYQTVSQAVLGFTPPALHTG